MTTAVVLSQSPLWLDYPCLQTKITPVLTSLAEFSFFHLGYHKQDLVLAVRFFHLLHYTAFHLTNLGIQSGDIRQSSPPLDNTSDASTLSDSSASSEGLIKIPWTIKNKYYSAPVHFAALRMHDLSPHQIQNIPALIFVWSQGEVCQFLQRASSMATVRDAEAPSVI